MSAKRLTDVVNPLAFLCGIETPERLKREAARLNVEIVKEQFLPGLGVQFTVIVAGVRGILVPTSPAARSRQHRAGRYLSPYSWVIS